MSEKHYKALFLPMPENDAGAETLLDYLRQLLRTLIIEEEGFSGKRPFGNSGWFSDFAYPLIKVGYIKGRIYEEDDCVCAESYSDKELTQFVLGMIDQMYETVLIYQDLQDWENE